MTVPCQRWRDRRDSYRPAGEPIRTADYEVEPMASDAEAKAFVEAHHYAASYPAARFRFGLRRHGDLVGVAVFSHPCRDEVLTNVFPGEARASVELGRLVLLDDVPANGESWMVARCFDVLRREGLGGVLSFSDPVPRARADGTVVKPGHVGTIYQALSGVFLGRATPRSLKLLPDGTVLSERAISKIRAGHRGWQYGSAALVRFGAEPLPADAEAEARMAWLGLWMPRLTRGLRHPGNFKYAWALDKAVRRDLERRHPAADRQPYPKAAEALAA
jgi:hypothetical protein